MADTMRLPDPMCPYCGRRAADMTDFDDAIVESPQELEKFHALPLEQQQRLRRFFVRSEEGTYNHENGHFACTPCYIRIGMPSSRSRSGWRCP